MRRPAECKMRIAETLFGKNSLHGSILIKLNQVV
jgi:hypothetical protein